MAVKADAASPLVGHPVRDLREHLPHIESRIVAIFRGNRAIIPDGDTMIEANDEVFFVASAKHIRQVTKELHQEERSVKRMMIAGGGNIGFRVARSVSGHMTPKIIEGNLVGRRHEACGVGGCYVVEGPSAAIAVGDVALRHGIKRPTDLRSSDRACPWQ